MPDPTGRIRRGGPARRRPHQRLVAVPGPSRHVPDDRDTQDGRPPAEQFKSTSPLELTSWARASGFPVVAKPLASSSSDHVFICRTAPQVTAAARQTLQLRGLAKSFRGGPGRTCGGTGPVGGPGVRSARRAGEHSELSPGATERCCQATAWGPGLFACGVRSAPAPWEPDSGSRAHILRSPTSAGPTAFRKSSSLSSRRLLTPTLANTRRRCSCTVATVICRASAISCELRPSNTM